MVCERCYATIEHGWIVEILLYTALQVCVCIVARYCNVNQVRICMVLNVLVQFEHCFYVVFSLAETQSLLVKIKLPSSI